MYRIYFAGRAERAFRKLSPEVQRRLDPSILALAGNPRPPGCLKLSGPDSLWRIRVGDYRIVYQIQDDALLILIIHVGHRREVYR
jgi:mRNA interferase RelE/StbE